jgi:hypothetical protein
MNTDSHSINQLTNNALHIAIISLYIHIIILNILLVDMKRCTLGFRLFNYLYHN